MIYDCFQFNDELDLLEIRLNHHSFVDKFILIESTRTYNGKPKPLNYLLNHLRYQEFKDKIYHIVLDFPFETNSGWQYEHLQRNILRGFTFQPDDLIIYSDCDEIIKDKTILDSDMKDGIIDLQMDLCFYYFNLRLIDKKKSHEDYHLNSCFGNKFHMAKVITPEFMMSKNNLYEIRQHNIMNPRNIVKNAGWHFSNLGDSGRILDKLQAISHWGESSFQGLTIERIEQNKNNLIDPLGRDGCIYDIIPDEDLPGYIINNKEKFNEYFTCERKA